MSGQGNTPFWDNIARNEAWRGFMAMLWGSMEYRFWLNVIEVV